MNLPKIYLYCIPTGGGSGDVHGSTPGGDVLGCAIAEDGTGLAHHLSSSPAFSRSDMGMPPSTWKHEIYKEHYPEGYELEWIEFVDVPTHAGLAAALLLNEKLASIAKGPCSPDAVSDSV